MGLIDKLKSTKTVGGNDVEAIVVRDGEHVIVVGKKVRAFKVTDLHGVQEVEIKPVEG